MAGYVERIDVGKLPPIGPYNLTSVGTGYVKGKLVKLEMENGVNGHSKHFVPFQGPYGKFGVDVDKLPESYWEK